MTNRAVLAATLCLALLAPLGARAQAQKPPAKEQKPPPAKEAPKDPGVPQRIGGAQNWTAYAYSDGKGKVCYLVGDPVKKEPANARRDRVNVLVTHNTGEKTQNVVSFVAGYAFADRAEVEVDVDGKKFMLFTAQDTAWARDPATDKAIVASLLKGKQAVVKGSSARGTATVDTYSLAGFAPTLAVIDKACNVKR
jgi:hypothetical protein